MSHRKVISCTAIAALCLACVSADALAAGVAARGGAVAYRGGAVASRGAVRYRASGYGGDWAALSAASRPGELGGPGRRRER